MLVEKTAPATPSGARHHQSSSNPSPTDGLRVDPGAQSSPVADPRNQRTLSVMAAAGGGTHVRPRTSVLQRPDRPSRASAVRRPARQDGLVVELGAVTACAGQQAVGDFLERPIADLAAHSFRPLESHFAIRRIEHLDESIREHGEQVARPTLDACRGEPRLGEHAQRNLRGRDLFDDACAHTQDREMSSNRAFEIRPRAAADALEQFSSDSCSIKQRPWRDDMVAICFRGSFPECGESDIGHFDVVEQTPSCLAAAITAIS